MKAEPRTLSPEEALRLLQEGQCPEGAVVDGDLRLKNLSEPFRLPAKLTVLGTLRARNCGGLQALPDGLKAFHVDLWQCPALESIGSVAPPDGRIEPDALKLNGNFGVIDCPKLKRLPRAITLGGYFHLEGCPLLGEEGTAFPERLSAVGHATFIACHGMRRLPAATSVKRGELRLLNCAWLKGIGTEGDACEAEGGLDIWLCPSLKAIEAPRQIDPRGHVGISDCRRLKRIADIEMGWGATHSISGCPKLAESPFGTAPPPGEKLSGTALKGGPPKASPSPAP